jgi:hypothetical protein
MSGLMAAQGAGRAARAVSATPAGSRDSKTCRPPGWCARSEAAGSGAASDLGGAPLAAGGAEWLEQADIMTLNATLAIEFFSMILSSSSLQRSHWTAPMTD